MTEESINKLRQADINLREALRLNEAERQQMPADLNERLMKRVGNDKKKTHRPIWPWIAAACVAGVMVIWLTPPKEEASPLPPPQEAKGTQTKEVVMPKVEKEIEPKIAKAETEAPVAKPAPDKAKTVKDKTTIAKRDAALQAQETKAEDPAAAPVVEEVHKDLAKAETAKPQEKRVTLTERDIPISRPENYKYTPEELALMKKQANEAYLKWAQLELEIAKHNLEQTAQK